ncbi:MAG: ABC transporter permease [Vicinamibacterales bacterium]
MDEFLRDLRLGVRQLRSRPGFAGAAIASLALGIGLNTTLFSVVNAVLLKRGPVAHPEELAEIYTGLDKEYPHLTTSYPDYLDIRDGADAFSGVEASSFVRAILSTGERPVLLTGEAVTANYFDVLGVQPAVGRPFSDEESRVPNASPVAVVSHGLWQRRFGGRPDVIGQTMKLSGVDYTIVGVAPPAFAGVLPGVPAEFWVPVSMIDRLQFAGIQTTTDNDPGATRLERRGARWLFVKGRLASGRRLEEARAQVETIFARAATAYPVTNEKATAAVLPAAAVRFHPMLDGYVRAASATLLVAVSLVLLIACANVANMLLASGAGRRRELALRAALGASRGRVVRQLLTEGLVLALAGGSAGVLVAWWAGGALSSLDTDFLPVRLAFDFSLDATVLAFALAASVATAIVFGLAPAWSASKPDLVPALKASVEGDRRRRWLSLRDALVVGQLALSLVLLVSGALLSRAFLTAMRVDLGFDPAPISSLSFNVQMNGYDVPRAAALRDRALAELRQRPGVVAVSTASRVPLATDRGLDSILVPGRHRSDDEATPVDVVRVGADYFSVLGVPLVAGRAFTADEVRHDRRVVIVNETLARQFWPAGDALGQRIHNGSFGSEPYEIVGIARDHKVRSVGEPPTPYLHFPDPAGTSMRFVVRTSTPAERALPMLRDAIRTLDADILFTEDTSVSEIVSSSVAPTRLGAIVLGAFGGLALLLAAVGLYGLVAYSVGRRTRELGIRLALGAERRQVLGMVLREGGRLALLGIVVGALASTLVGGVLESLLYGVSRFDLAAYGVAAGMLLTVAALANLRPALAAARIDPMRALRRD